MKRSSALFALFLLAGCKSNMTSPSGTEVLVWDSARSDRASVVSAKELGPRAKKEAIIQVEPDFQGPFSLKAQVETAEIEMIEDGKVQRHTAPLALRVMVDRNEDWTLNGRCLSGPHYSMPSMVEGKLRTPAAMLLDCDIKVYYKSTTKDLQLSMHIRFDGDGNIEPQMPSGKARVL